ncbi:MAG: site-specific tyrosine recombinase XerC [Hyphomonadaceae bacterium]
MTHMFHDERREDNHAQDGWGPPLRAEPMALPEALRQFGLYLAARNYSEFTIEQRHTAATAFIGWAAAQGVADAHAVTPRLIEAYRLKLHLHRKADGAPLGVRTQIARLVAVRALFRWLARERIISRNPCVHVELPRGERRLPGVILTESEVEAILALPDFRTPMGLRDRAILETLYVTGIRRMELTRLRLCDLDPARELLRVRKGKGGKDRVVPTGERALAWLIAYLAKARPELARGAAETDRLFLTAWGGPIAPKKLTARVSAYVSAARLNKTGACHLFRHAAATHMLEHGADVRFIQALLGHECLDTTRIYTHVSIGPLAAVHRRTHPAAKFREGDFASPARPIERLTASDSIGDRAKLPRRVADPWKANSDH